MNQLPTTTAAMPSLPITDPIPTGDAGTSGRTFNVGAVQAPASEPAVPAQVEAPTPEQEAGYEELMRMVGDSPERAARALELIKQVEAAKDCGELNKKCERHEDDHGEIIHFGREHREDVGDLHNVLTHRLTKWSNDSEPVLSCGGGGEWDDFNLAQTDELIEKATRQLASLQKCRAHLAAALGQPEPVYVPPTDWDDAEEIRTVGASGSILMAALYTPTDENGADEPQVLAVYSDTAGTTTDELDRAGALDLKAQLLAFLPKLDAMIDALPAEVAVEPPKPEKAQPAAYRPPLAADVLPEPGIDDSTVIALNLPGLDLKAGVHVSDDEHATRTIAVWTEGHRDGTDLDALDAERVAAALPAFTEQFQSLARRLAEQPVPYSVTEQAEDAK